VRLDASTLEDAFVALTGTRLHEEHKEKRVEHKEGALA
jgi:hypothetical protein